MGAWGYGSFENDDADDWVWELEGSSNFSVVRGALEAVVSENGNLEAPACSEAVAAAEVVAAALGRPVAGLPDEVGAWIEEHRDVPPDVVVLARRAVTRIADKSELRDLWEGSAHLAEWQGSMADLAARIAGYLDPGIGERLGARGSASKAMDRPVTESLDPWRSFTILRGIAFSTDPSGGVCTLVLRLADDVGIQARVVHMEFRGVANLTMRNLGGGLSQFCGLMSCDISSWQWDRLHYRVFDVEHDAIDFLCDSFDCHEER